MGVIRPSYRLLIGRTSVIFCIGEPLEKVDRRGLQSRIRNVKNRLAQEFLSRVGHEKSGLNSGGPPSKAKEYMRSIVNKYREGKVKRTPGGE